jgi:hypothetical protein
MNLFLTDQTKTPVVMKLKIMKQMMKMLKVKKRPTKMEMKMKINH